MFQYVVDLYKMYNELYSY